MPRPPTLSPNLLTFSLLGVAFGTVALLSFYAMRMGRSHDLPLPVVVDSGRFPVPVQGGLAVLAPSVRITNQSDAAIPNLTVVVNGEFHLYRDSPLAPHEVLVLPLEIFKTKANHPFRPETMSVRKVTVYGQLPSNARGVVDYRTPEDGKSS